MTRCEHFGTCGGCRFQDVAYEDQLANKQAALRELLGETMEIVPSPVEYGYRTRMDYVYGWGKLGLRKKGDGKSVLMLDECWLPPERAFRAVLAIRKEMQRLDIRSYQYTNHRGYLRYISLRAAPRNDQLLLNFLTKGTDPAIRPILDMAGELADAVVWSTTDRTADISVGETHEFAPRDWIEEKVGPHLLRFGANSFFQSNPWVTAAMYDDVVRRVHRESRARHVLRRRWLLDLAGSARRRSRRRRQQRGRVGVRAPQRRGQQRDVGDSFVSRGCAQVRGLEAGYDALILDPPRAGLGPKIVRRIARSGPPPYRVRLVQPEDPRDGARALRGVRAERLESVRPVPADPALRGRRHAGSRVATGRASTRRYASSGFTSPTTI